MTTLSNLSDVGDLSGATDDDYLGFDEASGLWIPKNITFEEYSFTAEYPEGDNGWVYFDDMSVACEHIQNIASMPSNDDAKVHEFTVTAGMLVGITGGEPWVPVPALKVTASFEVLMSATRACRMSVSVNGVQQSYSTNSVTTARRRLAVAATVDVEVGDVVAIHAWRTTGEVTETYDLVRVAAASTIALWPNGDLDGRSMMIFSPDMGVVASSWVDTAPSGELATIAGTTSSPTDIVRQNGAASFSATTSSLHVWALRSLELGAFRVRLREGATTISTDGDPYLFRTLQIEEARFDYVAIPEPA